MRRPALRVSLIALTVLGGAGLVACGDSGAGGPCAPTEDWDAMSTEFEEEVLLLVNEARAAGANCGSGGSFAPTSALSMQPQLRCAARMHSRDMARRDFFDHTNPDGEGPQPRIERAGYEWSTWGENIAFGYPSPEAVMDGWMGSDGHCSNIMNPNFTEIGVGHYEGNQWTQVFGAPR